MSDTITTIGFDADDTLWHNELFFKRTEARFAELLADYGTPEKIAAQLIETERANVTRYGFGIKGFTLSLIETALKVSDGQVPGSVISDILAAGQEMLTHPVETLPHARETIEVLKDQYRLVLITKGDLFDQERKLAASGLDSHFDAVEIVSNKTDETYRQIFARHGDGAERAVMVGNSLRSDIIPALAAGAWGIYVPHELLFALEHAEPPTGYDRFREISDLGALPGLLQQLALTSS